MKKRKFQRVRASDIASLVCMAIFTLILILPLLWLVSASFQREGEIYTSPFRWIPMEFQWKNYASAWKVGHLDTAFISSVIIAALYIPCHVISCVAIGFVFAKYRFRGKNGLFSLILMTMMIPQELTFFPIYGITRTLGLIDTHAGVVLPFLISGFGIFFMRQFCTYIPTAMMEAARIDGCKNTGLFFRIAIPQLRPAITALAILAFSFIWDEFAWSKLVLNSAERMSLPVRLTTLAISPSHEVQTTELLAASVLAMLPLFLLFTIFQKHFIASVTNSGIKG